MREDLFVLNSSTLLQLQVALYHSDKKVLTKKKKKKNHPTPIYRNNLRDKLFSPP